MAEISENSKLNFILHNELPNLNRADQAAAGLDEAGGISQERCVPGRECGLAAHWRGCYHLGLERWADDLVFARVDVDLVDLTEASLCEVHGSRQRCQGLIEDQSGQAGGAGASSRLEGGFFGFEGSVLPAITSALPTVVHIPRSETGAPPWLAAISHLLVNEARVPNPGSSLMISRLIDLLVIRALRSWASTQTRRTGWLAGLGEERISRALSAMHADPFRRCTVIDLAEVALMSRSIFAQCFAATVGEPPLHYLARWRLTIAADLLRSGGMKVTEAAQRVGYASDAAFSRAFKAHFGYSPSEARMGGASYTDLTQATGVERPALYSAFGNKEALFRRALKRYYEHYMDFIPAALEQPTWREVAAHILRGAAELNTRCPVSFTQRIAIQAGNFLLCQFRYATIRCFFICYRPQMEASICTFELSLVRMAWTRLRLAQLP